MNAQTASIAATSASTLITAYNTALPHLAGTLTVVTEPSEVDARVLDLRAKLTALGVEDVTQEGRLVLGGSVAVTPGVSRGVRNAPPIATHVDLDLDTYPALFEYTVAARRLRSSAPRGPGRVPAARAPAGARPHSLAAPTKVARSMATASAGAGPRLALNEVPIGAGVNDITLVSIHTDRTLVALSSPVLLQDEAILIADEIQFQDGMTLVISSEVKYLTIIAQRITVGDDVTISWESAAAATRGRAENGTDGSSYSAYVQSAQSAFNSPDGGDGQDGDDGDPGYPGDDAPTLEIWALQMARLPAIELQGGKGGTGQRGGDGGDGGDGCKGLESHSMAWGCDRSVGYGGDGGDGGDGGKGGDGGRGGVGGNLTLYLTDAVHEAVLAAGLADNRAGGSGGDPGDPGNGGAKGEGGEAGEPSGFWCHPKPERAGNDGVAGKTGQPGSEGSAGASGRLTAVVITPEQFRVKWTAPQIRTVSPGKAEVGATVTIDGANFTRSAVVRIGSETADTTFIAGSVLQAEVPMIGTGWADVVVEIPGGQTSNPGSLKILPTMIGASPNPAALGTPITVYGSGFEAGCHVLFRGVELDPLLSTDGTTATVTLPAPSGPFEDHGGVEPIIVINPDGIATEPFDLTLRHVLSTGFVVPTNSYAFTNSPTQGMANLSTFADTFGAADVAMNFLLEPVLTGAFYAAYVAFFNATPGYSSGFSTTAADEYWSGNPDLNSDHSAITEVERLLTVAQGHVLSQEMLTLLAGQALAGVGRAETTLNEVEANFRDQLTMTADRRRLSASIIQLMPAGTIFTSGFINNLNFSHGLLPIRVEYPEPGETWEKRIAVYDNNNSTNEEMLTFTRDSNGLLGFTLSGDTSNRTTASGWTLSQASLYTNWLSPKTIPTDYVFILSPATVLIEDAEGRKFGVKGKQVWNDLPDVIPAIGMKNLWLLPLDRDLTISLTGTGKGKYTFGVCSGTLGRSVTLTDIAVTPKTRDVVRVSNRLRDVTVESSDNKDATIHYGVGGVGQARAVKVSARVGRQAGVTLRSLDNLDTIELDGAGRARPLRMELTGADRSTVSKQSFDGLEIGGGVKRFGLSGWKALSPTSLLPLDPAPPKAAAPRPRKSLAGAPGQRKQS